MAKFHVLELKTVEIPLCLMCIQLMISLKCHLAWSSFNQRPSIYVFMFKIKRVQLHWNDTFSGFRKSVHYYKTKPTAREWLLSETRARNWQHQIYGNTQWNQGILLIHRKMFPEATNSTFHLKQNILTQLRPVQFRAASAFQNVIHSIH